MSNLLAKLRRDNEIFGALKFKIGDTVKVSDNFQYAGDWREEYVVVEIRWEYQRPSGPINITIASSAEIAANYGATDGFRPEDLELVTGA